MKKKVLSVLLGCSLLMGTVFANAVSIEFEDLDKMDSSNFEIVSNIEDIEIPKEDEIIETGFYINNFPKAVEEDHESELIQHENLDLSEIDAMPSSKSLNENNIFETYFIEASSVKYFGNDSIVNGVPGGRWGNSETYLIYKNTSVESYKYVIYENAVKAGNKNYDLVIYPFRCSRDAQIIINIDKMGKSPIFKKINNGYCGYKLLITEHGNINNKIGMDVLFGISDLDETEYFIVSSNYKELYVGENVNTQQISSPVLGTKYEGITSTDDNLEAYSKNAALGILYVPEDGVILYYGSNGSHRAEITFTEMKKIFDDKFYNLNFNANEGIGNIPSPIIKYGSNASIIMENIGEAIPSRTGYTFKGWSAVPELNEKRISYDNMTGTIQTSDSWTYADYCSYTGGDSSNRSLTLYAQWEPEYTYTLAYNANGGINAPASSTVLNSSSTYSMTVSSSAPTRTGYTFAGWNTNSSGTGTNYSAGSSVSVGANATVMLYAKWTPVNYSITYNLDGGTATGNPTSYNIETATFTLNNPTKTGYTFTGWTGSNGSTASTSVSIAKGSTGNKNYTANWQPVNYNITYTLNGGSVTGNPITYNIETATFTLKNPTRTGYTFTGWTGSNGNTASISVSIAKGSTGNKEYTANWKINQYPVTYIDIDENGNELGRTTKQINYDATVRGSDIGGSTTDNAYYNQYRYVSDTSAKVTTDGAVVYRVFEFCETEAKANLQWNDNNNADGFRPEKYKLKLKQNGKIIDEVELSSDTTNYTFPDLPKYDSNGNAYKYTFDVNASERYNIRFDENGNLIIEDYLPASFSVVIPKNIVLDGNTGNADYAVSVNGTFYYNDTLTVKPESSLTLADRSKISSIDADVNQQKTAFRKEDGVANGTTAAGSVQANRSHFAGSWSGNFNFDIKFVMQN